MKFCVRWRKNKICFFEKFFVAESVPFVVTRHFFLERYFVFPYTFLFYEKMAGYEMDFSDVPYQSNGMGIC